MAVGARRTLDDAGRFEHPLYQSLLQAPGAGVGVAALDDLLAWGVTNALWVFPMATSCCGIELMAAAASRVDVDRMGVIVRGTPRQADVMVVAGTITTKMAPRVLKLWEQMPQPRFCIAMGSCAMSGDFYRNLYSVVPGIDTFLPVDVYVPGCPPNPEALMAGLLELKRKVASRAEPAPVPDAAVLKLTKPSVPRLFDAARAPGLSEAQAQSAATATQAELAPALEVPPLPPLGAPLLASDFDAALKELGVSVAPNHPPLVALPDHLRLAARLQALGYRQLVTVAATHFPVSKTNTAEHCELFYALRTVGAGASRLATWTVRAEPGQAVPSLSSLFAGADWQEREQYDLLGVTFAGHRDLRRLMMAGNFEGHPLRREFPSDAAAAPWR
jgi:NADH-quinone oxidoreductase subunit B/C/D